MKKENHGKYTIKKRRLCQIAISFFVVLAVVFVFFIFARMRLIRAVKDAAEEGTRMKALEVRDELKKNFSILETIGKLWGRQLSDGVGFAEDMKELPERYQISHIAFISDEMECIDSLGTVYPPAADGADFLFGLTGENLKKMENGGTAVFYSNTAASGEGFVLAVPYAEGDKKGIVCMKLQADVVRERLMQRIDGVSWSITDIRGKIFLTDGKLSEYFEGGDWKTASGKNPPADEKGEFVRELRAGHAALEEIKGSNGEKLYFTMFGLYEYPDLYMVGVSDVSLVIKGVSTPLNVITYLLVLVILFLIIITVYSVVMSRRNRQELYRTAFEDPLTKLPAKSKHKMDAQELINRADKKYAYIAFDVENFKYINELFGYEFGNRLLIHIAAVVKRFTGKGELCSRTAGDNFGMLFVYDGDSAALKERLDKIFTAMAEYSEEESDLNFCAVKYACGVYLVEGVEDINKIRANANLARIESKKQLFDKIVFYNDVLKKKHVEERELEYDSKEALGNGEFIVYYQPKYDTGTELIIGAEALIRWNHPKKGLLPPITFIPLFEANGFIIDLDMYVLKKTCELLSDWIKRGIEPVCISVNLSRTHLYEQNLADQLEKLVQSYQVPPKYIEFELTESAFYEDMSNLLGVMAAIRKKGFRLSMDDFGSGYSSLNLLRHLPVDVLKLDKEFLDGGEENLENRDKQIIEHVIAMAKDLEMRVLAEGVETEEQKDFLREARCDIIQGYYFARPMPRKDFEERYLRQFAKETV